MEHQRGETADPDDVRAVAERARVASPRCGRVVVVAIDGPSGSGKTTLAKGVAAALSSGRPEDRPVPVVHMDQLFPGWDGLARAPQILATEVLEPLGRGEDAPYREWDWAADAWGATVDLPWSDLLVVEGCGSSVAPAGELGALRVWVEADRDERRRRGLARDGESFAPYWERWARQEAELFRADRTRARAHLVINTSDAARPARAGRTS